MNEQKKKLLIAISKGYVKDSEKQHPYMKNGGFVRITREFKPYGWCVNLGSACTECVGSYAVSQHGEIYQTIGGDDINGAKDWIRL